MRVSSRSVQCEERDMMSQILLYSKENIMNNEEIKIKSEDESKRPRKPPKLLIFGIAIISGVTLTALLLRVLMFITGAL